MGVSARRVGAGRGMPTAEIKRATSFRTSGLLRRPPCPTAGGRRRHRHEPCAPAPSAGGALGVRPVPLWRAILRSRAGHHGRAAPEPGAGPRRFVAAPSPGRAGCRPRPGTRLATSRVGEPGGPRQVSRALRAPDGIRAPALRSGPFHSSAAGGHPGSDRRTSEPAPPVCRRGTRPDPRPTVVGPKGSLCRSVLTLFGCPQLSLSENFACYRTLCCSSFCYWSISSI